MAVKGELKKENRSKWKKLVGFLRAYSIFFLIIFFGVLYSFIAVTKYNHYQTGLDLAIYVQTMWFYTHLKLPFVTLFPTYGDLVWADHFGPGLMLLTPLYFLWHDPRMLLVMQSFIYVSGAYPVYRFAKEKLFSVPLALTFALSFLMFFGVQFPLTFDFHLGTMAASFMAWILWAMFLKKWKTFLLLCIAASSFKEDMPLYVAALSLYLIITRKNWRLGLSMFVAFLGYDILITKYIMPTLAYHAAKTFSLSYFSPSPWYLWSVFLNSAIKIQTMLLSFSYVFFLPFFSGFFLIIPLAHFFISFSNPEFPGRWGIYLHYRGYLCSILMFSTIIAYANFMKKKPKIFTTRLSKSILSIALIFNILLFDYMLHLPLNNLLKPQFYYKESWIGDNNRVLQKIPKNAYLLTMNSLAPQTAFREYISYYPQNYPKADYIFFDKRSGQSFVNFWLTSTAAGFVPMVNDLIAGKDFVVAYRSHDAVLLKRVRDFVKDKKSNYENHLLPPVE